MYDQRDFYKEWDEKQVNELQGILESIDLMNEHEEELDKTQPKEEESQMMDFERKPLKWWFENLPARLWLSGASFVIAAFIGGVYAGQTTLVRELIGKPV